MLLAGIVGPEGMMKTASLINSFFTSTGKRVSVADSASLNGLDSKRVKSYIQELGKNKTDILLLKLNGNDIEKLVENGVCFDVVIFTGTAGEDEEPGSNEVMYPDKLRGLMSERGVSIVNVDDGSLLSMLDGLDRHIVTYGFNSKASITTSSIGDPAIDGDFMCCLQHAIPARNGKLIEPQEYKLKLEPGLFDTSNILAAASFAIINGIDLNAIN